jgi:hypothetical protein
LVRYLQLAQTLVAESGVPAAKALTALDRAHAIQLSKLHAEGSALSRDPRVLAVIERCGDRGMAFIWRNNGALAVNATLVAFLNDPDSFINGHSTLDSDGTREAAGGNPIIRRVNRMGEWVMYAAIGMAVLIVVRWWRANRAPGRQECP